MKKKKQWLLELDFSTKVPNKNLNVDSNYVELKLLVEKVAQLDIKVGKISKKCNILETYLWRVKFWSSHLCSMPVFLFGALQWKAQGDPQSGMCWPTADENMMIFYWVFLFINAIIPGTAARGLSTRLTRNLNKSKLFSTTKLLQTRQKKQENMFLFCADVFFWFFFRRKNFQFRTCFCETPPFIMLQKIRYFFPLRGNAVKVESYIFYFKKSEFWPDRKFVPIGRFGVKKA